MQRQDKCMGAIRSTDSRVDLEAGEFGMAIGDGRSDRGLSLFATFVLASAVVIAIAVLAYHPKAGASPGVVSPARLPEAASGAQGHRMANNQLAIFLERWTSTAETAGADHGH
jgi:hypothetical protein